MKKKTKVILIIVIILLIAIPLGVFAAKEAIIIPKWDEQAIQEANQKETNRALEEKAKFAQEHANSSSTNTNQTNVASTSIQQEDTKASQEAMQNGERIKELIKQYYPIEYDELNNNTSESKGLVDMKNSTLTSSESKVYDLVLKILENENLSNNDSILLKDYISGEMYNIKKDENLKIRANAILNN